MTLFKIHMSLFKTDEESGLLDDESSDEADKTTENDFDKEYVFVNL